MKSKINWKILIISLILVYASAFIGGIFTSSKVNSAWYDSIKPVITPPNYIFPIVWNILFFLIALSLYLSWTSSKKKDKKGIALVFGINLILNILWSVSFFGLQNPVLAFFELIFLWISILFMLIITYKIKRMASYLLTPYLLWVTFAGFLNYLIAF